MKLDPDFHPLAAKWLDGQATPPEQAVLQDILEADPAAVDEFAALCHTSELLVQHPQSPADRRKHLESLLSGKPWPARAAKMIRHPNFRRAAAAAAAVLTAGVWAFWPTGSTGQNSVASHRSPESPFPETNASRSVAGDLRAAGELEESNIDPDLRKLLERLSIGQFEANGPLPDAAAQLTVAINGHPETAGLRIRTDGDGDAEVFLKFKTEMPAWCLLQMMALQTGTTLSSDADGSLTFLASEKPASLEKSDSRTSSLESLRALLQLRARDQEGDQLTRYRDLVAGTLGSGITFQEVSDNKIQFSGASRGVKVLKAATDAALALPARSELTIYSAQIPLGLYPGMAVYKPQQFAEFLESALPINGTLFQILVSRPVLPNEEITGIGRSDRNGTHNVSETSIFAKSEPYTVDLDIENITESTLHGSQGTSTQTLSVKIMAWAGQTVTVGGSISDGYESLIFVTASEIDPGMPSSSQGAPDRSDAVTQLSDAIPVDGKPGFVTSPYAEVPAEFDISSLKPGSTFTCPLSGKKLRVP